jgi:hypothetical protein
VQQFKSVRERAQEDKEGLSVSAAALFDLGVLPTPAGAEEVKQIQVVIENRSQNLVYFAEIRHVSRDNAWFAYVTVAFLLCLSHCLPIMRS